MFRRCSLAVAPRFLWECLNSQTVNPFPASATSRQSAIWSVVSPFEKVGARFVPSNSKTARRAMLSDDGQTGSYPSIGNG